MAADALAKTVQRGIAGVDDHHRQPGLQAGDGNAAAHGACPKNRNRGNHPSVPLGFDDKGNALPATDAHRCKAIAPAVALQLMDQLDQNDRARGPDRIERGLPLADVDQTRLYTTGPEGFIDYPGVS
ncbi:hypothetical protein MASR2M74_03880 [Paracoccaceae bacterium]